MRGYSEPDVTYATTKSAGADLYAKEGKTVKAGGRILIPVKSKGIDIEENHCGLICPRSGLALKHGITVLNAPGVIDCDYTGEWGVILYNSSTEDYEVKEGDRVAQLIIVNYRKVYGAPVLSAKERQDGGYGSSGK